MLSMRQVARTAFRLAAAVEPPPANGSTLARSLFDPRHLARAGMLTARFGSEVIDTLLKGPGATIGYTELDNKVRAFHFFETEAAHLESLAAGMGPAEGIRSAQERLGHEQAVWASEGVGYELFERRRKSGQSMRGLFTGPGDGVPNGSWTVLHTGMGMALAESWLERLPNAPDPGRLSERLAEHRRLCEDAARTRYVELAFEPLGLVTRLLRGDLVPALGAQLERLAPPWSDLFWHGVGRGLYFHPANLAPGRSSPWAGLDMCRDEPPHESGRRNAVSGFSWAVTLVNLRRPEVVETFLSHHLEPGAAGEPVSQGVLSALLLWHETTHGSRELRQFVAHVAAPERRSLWHNVVRGPFEEEVRKRGPWGAAEGGQSVGELFRYR